MPRLLGKKLDYKGVRRSSTRGKLHKKRVGNVMLIPQKFPILPEIVGDLNVRYTRVILAQFKTQFQIFFYSTHHLVQLGI